MPALKTIPAAQAVGTPTPQLLADLEPNADDYWPCPVEGCEKGPFKGKSGIAMHLTGVHGAVGSKHRGAAKVEPEESDPDSMTAQVRSQLRELTAPLREQSADIDRRLTALRREQRDLREAKRQIDGVISKLEDSPAKQRMAPVSNGSEARSEDRRKVVEEFIQAHRDLLEDGFTMNSLCDTMKENGALAMTTKTMRPVVDALRDAGVIRADRVVKGGGMSYHIV